MSILQKRALICLPVIIFICLAYLVTQGHTKGFDESGVLLLRGNSPTVIAGDFWQTLVSQLTHLGDSVVLAIISVVTVGVLYWRNQKQAAHWFLIAAAGSFIITAFAKWAFGRDRPEIVEQIVTASSASFPSGHTLRSAVVYSLLAFMFLKMGTKKINYIIFTIASAIILMNGISRVYLGVHWPTDIIAAWLIAGFWLLLCKAGYDRACQSTSQ